MKEHEAVGTAWMRVGKKGGRWSAVLTYAALLMLVPKGTKQIRIGTIARTAGVSPRTAFACVRQLVAWNLVGTDRRNADVTEYTLKSVNVQTLHDPIV